MEGTKVESSKPAFDWLYPDLLTRQELIDILKMRYVKVESLESLDKPGLVELYSKVIIPLPQRKYRHNRRGRTMTKKQILMAKKRRISDPSAAGQSPEKRQHTGNLVTSFQRPGSSGDRLKPPPVNCVDFKKKTIKLGSGSVPHTDNVSTSLNKLKVVDSSDSAAAAPKKLKLIKSKKCETEVDSIPEGMNDTSSVKINKVSINSVDTMENHSEPVPMDIAESNDVKETKIRKITWP